MLTRAHTTVYQIKDATLAELHAQHDWKPEELRLQHDILVAERTVSRARVATVGQHPQTN